MCDLEHPCRAVLSYATERALAAQPAAYAQSEAVLYGIGWEVNETVVRIHDHVVATACGPLLITLPDAADSLPEA